MSAALASRPPIISDCEVGTAPRRAVLALDLGTTTGWALRSGDGAITSGTMTFRPSRFEGGGMRFLRFRAWLTEVTHLAGALSQIAFEEVRAHGRLVGIALVGRVALDRADWDALIGGGAFLAPCRKMSQKGRLQVCAAPSLLS
jgi:hypothetical protein